MPQPLPTPRSSLCHPCLPLAPFLRASSPHSHPWRPAAEDVEGVKELVEDYLERNQDDFEEFDAPDDL